VSQTRIRAPTPTLLRTTQLVHRINLVAAIDDYTRFLEELQASKPWRSYIQLKQLKMSGDILMANADALLKTLKALPTPEVFMAIGGQDQEQQRERAMTMVMQFMFNFLASGQSLNDHLDNFSARYSGKLGMEYADQLGSRWRDLPVTHVVKRLRNVFLHQEIPPYKVTFHVDVAGGNKLDVAVTLNVDALLKMKGWNANDRLYLERLRHPGRLEVIVEPYRDAAHDFLRWLLPWHQKVAEVSTFEELGRMQERANEIQKAVEREAEAMRFPDDIPPQDEETHAPGNSSDESRR